jgi:hypothetical protein
MKVRGKLTVTDGIVLSPTKTVDETSVDAYVFARGTDAESELVLGDLVVYNVASKTYKKAGALVRYGEDLYISLVRNARGVDIADPLVWRKVTVEGIALTPDQMNAIKNAANPSAANAFATLGDITNLTIEGTAAVDGILGKPATVKNIIWISSTIGEDSFGVDVVKGDGLISTGSGWKNIGPIGATAQQSTYVHTQGTPSSVWRITHNLDRYPSIVVVDEYKDVVSALQKYVDKNIVEITFSEPIIGAAYLN